MTDPTPAWAPTTTGTAVATLKGARRVGGRLTCVPPRFGNGAT